MKEGILRPLLAAAASAAMLAGCGGGGGGGSSPSPPPTVNTQAIVVDGGPAKVPNIAFTSVTICAPGTNNCQTIDHIQVDTGSTGLRILAPVISAGISLPQQTDAAGNPLVECAQFVDGFSWGPVKMADIRIAGEQASSVPIQVIGDSNFTSVPVSCSSSGPPENTVQTFGANGLLGVGQFLQDCGPACAQAARPGSYYSCPAGAPCKPVQIALSQQLQNPVALFAADNNGVIIQLPSVPDTGASTASGSITFGIGTQADNALGSATVLPTNPSTGTIVTTYNGHVYTNSYIDSGSNLIFFGINAFPLCSGIAQGLYCPNATQSPSATLQGTSPASSNVNFSVANADQLFSANPSFNAFDNLAAPSGDNSTFAWGMSFFFGRTVFTAIEQRNTPGGQGPYFAF